VTETQTVQTAVTEFKLSQRVRTVLKIEKTVLTRSDNFATVLTRPDSFRPVLTRYGRKRVLTLTYIYYFHDMFGRDHLMRPLQNEALPAFSNVL
jgi:hypothetical protein